jgi:hypothetical protein
LIVLLNLTPRSLAKQGTMRARSAAQMAKCDERMSMSGSRQLQWRLSAISDAGRLTDDSTS